MKPQRIDVLLKTVILLGGLLAVPAWASSARCALGGTGMGGTGIVAEGTGMGGTGITSGSPALAGKVMFSNGRVVAQYKGGSRLLAKGDPICVGDTILSSKAASAQIKMIDNEMIALRSETRIRIDSYAYRGKSDDNIALSLFNGAARIISGEIGKHFPQNDLVRTPTATIGVRGTDHEAAVILPEAHAGYPAGTYDKVNSGVTFIRTDKGSIDIHPNQVGFAAGPAEMPQILQTMPGFYNDPSIPLSSRGTDGKSKNGESGMQHGMEQSIEGAGENPEWTRGSDSELRSLPEPQSLPESPQMPEPSSPGEMMQPGTSITPEN